MRCTSLCQVIETRCLPAHHPNLLWGSRPPRETSGAAPWRGEGSRNSLTTPPLCQSWTEESSRWRYKRELSHREGKISEKGNLGVWGPRGTHQHIAAKFVQCTILTGCRGPHVIFRIRAGARFSSCGVRNIGPGGMRLMFFERPGSSEKKT